MHLQVPAPGSAIWIRQRRWRVERARLDRHVLRLDVASRETRLTFLAPFDRPAAAAPSRRPRHVRPRHAIARAAHLVAHAGSALGLLAALDANVRILSHQLEPALAVLAGTRRVLIADAVGLGKTIQAALVLAELWRRAGAIRALVLAPAPLCRQWQRELAERFALTAEIAERHALEEAARAGRRADNPWLRHPLWIASPDYVKQRHVLDGLPLTAWDVVIIDEAHDVCGDSARHDACHAIAERARCVLLLTATPHSGDETRFSRLRRLGTLDGLDADRDALTIFRRTRANLTLPAARRVRWHGVSPSAAEREAFDALQAFERAVLRHARGNGRRDTALLLLAVFRKRALSTARALDVSLGRRLAWLDGPVSDALDWVQPSFDFGEGADDGDDAERAALTSDIGIDARQERLWIRRLQTLARRAMMRESKLARLRALVARVREPVVVFTEFRDSLAAIERALPTTATVAMLHGGQSAAERQRELDRFLGGDARVLAATDVASQGLNLQMRARWIVSLELPWNPTRLEQRIGRVDRIGQTRQVHATLLLVRHQVEAGLLRRLAARLDIARRSLGGDGIDLPMPDESAVRAAILADGPIRAPVGMVPMTPCRRYARRARALARILEQRRALAARGRRGGDSGPRRPAWAVLRRAICPRGPNGGATLIFTVPIVDASGALVEQRVAAVRCDGPIPASRERIAPAAIDRARDLVAAALDARRARLGRGIRDTVDRQLDIERAIADRLRALAYPEEVQAGLFDRVSVRTFEMARADAGAEADRERARLAQIADRIDLHVGRAVLELVLHDPA